MANFLSNGAPLSETIKSVTNNDFLTIFKQKYTNTTNISHATTNLKTDTNIDERQNLTGYQLSVNPYSNTDISTYSIAHYTEHDSGYNPTPTLPTWCTAIRAVLIGAGGAGATGLNATVTQHVNNFKMYTYDFQGPAGDYPPDGYQAHYTTYPINLHFNSQGRQFDLDIPNYKNNTGQQDVQYDLGSMILNYNNKGNSTGFYADYHVHYSFTSGLPGATGGGGGYIYLPVLSVARAPTVTVGSIGDTVLVASGYTLTAGGASAGQGANNYGGSGAYDAQVLSVTGASGQHGAYGGRPGMSSPTVYGAYQNYGYGGAGGAGGSEGTFNTATPNPGSAGSAGASGYCRIYYLIRPLNAVIPSVVSSLNSPQVYLKLDTNSTDNGSLGKTITTNGTITYTTIGSKKCAYFDNNKSNYLNFPFDYATADFTFCFWIYVNNNNYYTAVGIGNTARDNTAFHIDTGYVDFSKYRSYGIYGFVALNITWTIINGYCSDSYVTNWTHVAFSVKQTSNQYFAKQYINGQLISQQNGVGTLGSGYSLVPTTWVIGRSADNARPFYGYIREFCVYSGLLTDTQIQQVYNATM